MKLQWKQPACALLAAFIWGTAFVAQSVSAAWIAPFTFNALRSLVAVMVLGGYVLIRNGLRKKKGTVCSSRRKDLWLGGFLCGVFLFVASNLQQVGIGGSGAGKSGFLTALYIVIVPLLGMIFRKKAPVTVWVAVSAAVVGLYFLCVSGDFSMEASDLALLGCAFVFSCQILAVDHYSPRVDGVELSLIQFLFVAVFSAAGALVFESPSVEPILACLIPILYVGVFSSGVAYTLQIVAQKGSNPTVISLLLSLEAFFSAVAGAILLQERLTPRELLGCGILLVAVVIAQLPPFKGKKSP